MKLVDKYDNHISFRIFMRMLISGISARFFRFTTRKDYDQYSYGFFFQTYQIIALEKQIGTEEGA